MEEDFKGLSVEDLCAHKSWKARLQGYDRVVKIFEEIEEGRSAEWGNYVNLLKDMVTDNNVSCQERGLEAAVLFVGKSSLAGRVASDLVSGVVGKCLAAGRPRTRELATEVVLKLVELEKQNPVLEQVLEGVRSKNPKVRVASVQLLQRILTDFGAGPIDDERVLKGTTPLLEDKDKTVRQETRLLFAKMNLAIGDCFKRKLTATTKPNQLTDIESEYEKIKDTSIIPTRFICSEQSRHIPKNDESIQTSVNNESGRFEKDNCDKLEKVNVLKNLTEDFYKKLQSKKWSERKEVLEDFIKTLQGCPSLENGDYGDVIRTLKAIIVKDSNVSVVTNSIICITWLAKGLRKNFRQYANVILPALFEKFKEKKQTVVIALREAVDAVYFSTNLEDILEDALTALDDKNPSVKAEVLAFLIKAFQKITQSALNKKTLKLLLPRLSAALRNQDPSVREKAAEALGTAMKIVGEKVIKPYLTDVDEVCMKKIKECFQNAQIVVSHQFGNQNGKPALPTEVNNIVETQKTIQVRKLVRSNTIVKRVKSDSECKLPTIRESDTAHKRSNKQNIVPEISHCTKNGDFPMVDLKFKLNDFLLNELSHNNWKVRLEAILKLETLVTSAQSLAPNLYGVDSLIAKRIQDSNNKITEKAIALVASLVIAMGSPSKCYMPVFLPVLLKAIGDRKSTEGVISCLNSWTEVCGLGKLLEGPMVVDALKSGTPTAHSEIWTWLAGKLVLAPVKSIPEACLIALTEPLYAHLECRHSEIRKRASEAVLGVMTHLGFEKMKRALDSNKRTKSSLLSLQGILEKARDSIRDRPLLCPPENKISGRLNCETKVLQEEELKPFMLQNNDLKMQRIIDQGKNKQSNTNMVEQTKDLMISAKVNASLIADLFHVDFRYQLRGIDTLSGELLLNKEGLKCNLDIVLRWIVLKGFHMNEAGASKSLDYVHRAFEILQDEHYYLLDGEAKLILPYLITKVGEPNEIFRNKARGILKIIVRMHSNDPLLPHILEGLKSTNDRGRFEVINLFSLLLTEPDTKIARHTLTTILKSIATLIEDGDTAVRQSALDLLVLGVVTQGENVFEVINGIPEKYKNLIKYRAQQSRNLQNTNIAKDNTSLSIITNNSTQDTVNMEERSLDFEREVSDYTIEVSSLSKHRTYDEIFDLNFENEKFEFMVPKLIEIDLQFLEDPTREMNIDSAKEYMGTQISAFRLTKSGEQLVNKVLENSERAKSIFENWETAKLSKMEIYFILDVFISDLIKLLVELDTEEHPGVIPYYYGVFSILKKFFDKRSLCSNISEDNLYKLLERLLLRLSDGKTNTLKKEVNVLIFSLLENSWKSSAICSLLNLLLKRMEEKSDRFPDLVSRCLWKLINDPSCFSEEMDVESVICRINTFLNIYPRTLWGKESNPPRTVKALLLTLVKFKKSEVLEVVGKLEKNSKIVRMTNKYLNKNNKNQINTESNDLNGNCYCNRNNDIENVKNSSHSYVETTGKEEVVNIWEQDISPVHSNMPHVQRKDNLQTTELWRRLKSLKEKLGFYNGPSPSRQSIDRTGIMLGTSIDILPKQ